MRDRISVLGLGYVGLPVATSLGHAGFEVLGFDFGTRRISEVLERVGISAGVTLWRL